MRRIRKVAVLGSGVMGTGIACHLANVGLEVVMLDILPFDLQESEKDNKKARNRMADLSLKKALKSKPAPLYDKAFASRITTGNFKDDMAKIADCDWIIEVIIEKLEIKRSLFELVEEYRKPGTLITSNTSGIPITLLAMGRSRDFKDNFCGTHFFNPARYMRLFEVIPHSGTKAEVIDFFLEYGDKFLGKETVLCKDTPAFIANRIGFFSGSKVMELTEKYNFTIEEVDKLTGAGIGWPSTGSYRLLDLVGLDTSVKVTNGVIENCPEDEFVQTMSGKGIPKFMEYLVENKFLGNKTGQGFYKKTKQRDEKGKSIILAFDLEKLEYRDRVKVKLPVLGVSKKIEIMSKRMAAITSHDSTGGQFYKDYFAGLFAYAANRIPEISDTIFAIDDAMKAGYAWGYGPFEYWDMLGVEAGAKMAKDNGESIPEWIDKMIAAGHDNFYKVIDGQINFYNQETGKYEVKPGADYHIILKNITTAPLYKNPEATVHDLGEKVMCVEFTSKSNVIGQGTGEALQWAIDTAEKDGWNGVVIGNNAKNFSVGANLMMVGMMAMQGQMDELDKMVNDFQQVCMRMRYSAIPVVMATQGYVFGGGCEMLMHCDAAVVAAESYIGLVEVGVGLLPGGGGTKEFALRASESFFEGDVQIPTLIDKLKTIATASVGTSGHESYNLGYLQKDRDTVVVNVNRVISEAKKKVLQLSDYYIQPTPRKAKVLGRTGLATLYVAINEFYLGKYMSEYDVEISRKIAYVLAGGDLTFEQEVSEQYLLDIERKAFLELLANKKTQERIMHMLETNKPLRN